MTLRTPIVPTDPDQEDPGPETAPDAAPERARCVPLWIVQLGLLVLLLAFIGFGWLVKTTMQGETRFGLLGELAVKLAHVPDTTAAVLTDLSSYATGDYVDTWISVWRPPDADYSGFDPVPAAAGLAVPGLRLRTEAGRPARGWRLLAGTVHLNGAVENAALLLSPALEVVHAWTLGEVPVGLKAPRPAHRKFLHGVAILPDGSLVFTFDGSISLQRVDRCGNRLWSIPGGFHHAVTLDDDRETVWTFSARTTLARVAVADGTVLQEIPADAIIAANPGTDILELRRHHASAHKENSRGTTGRWLAQPLHLNDVDPLPAALAERFDGFEAGDLLVSARSLNLVFVLDPRTLRIRWWRVGAVQRQHDPDWLADGRIAVLNNRMSRTYSTVVALDPATFETSVLLDGRRTDFYTRIRGKHQVLEDGTMVVTSSQQGRAFEVDPNGDVVLELVNLKPDSRTTNYVISELKWLPPDYFTVERWECPD